MAGLARDALKSTPKDLVPLRCDGCGRQLMRIDAGALRPGKMIEAKCPKCDFFTYEIGTTS